MQIVDPVMQLVVAGKRWGGGGNGGWGALNSNLHERVMTENGVIRPAKTQAEERRRSSQISKSSKSGCYSQSRYRLSSVLVYAEPGIGAQLTQQPEGLGAHNAGVVRGVWQGRIMAVVQEAVSPAAITEEKQGGQEDQGTDGAWLPLQQKAEQVKTHEHRMVEPQGRVQRFRDEEDRQQPLKAVHGV